MIEKITNHTAVRYLFSGGVGLCCNLGILFILTSVFDVWYLAASMIAFACATAVSFLLQKFLTFRDHSVEKMHVQIAFFLLISLINLGLNTILEFLMVDKLHLHHLVGQFIAAALVAVGSFFAYRYVFTFTSRQASFGSRPGSGVSQ